VLSLSEVPFPTFSVSVPFFSSLSPFSLFLLLDSVLRVYSPSVGSPSSLPFRQSLSPPFIFAKWAVFHKFSLSPHQLTGSPDGYPSQHKCFLPFSGPSFLLIPRAPSLGAELSFNWLIVYRDCLLTPPARDTSPFPLFSLLHDVAREKTSFPDYPLLFFFPPSC